MNKELELLFKKCEEFIDKMEVGDADRWEKELGLDYESYNSLYSFSEEPKELSKNTQNFVYSKKPMFFKTLPEDNIYLREGNQVFAA